MKISLNRICLLFIVVLVIGTNTIQAQKVAVPINCYGVWDRGEGIEDYADPKADFVLGIEVMSKWADIQPKGPNDFDFSAFQNTLDKAEKFNKIVKISINVGPESPLWLYDYGVPLVHVKSNKPKNAKYENTYPYYLSENYKQYYFELIKKFSLFLRNQPKDKFDCIAFVQVKTGSTGDEEPYKGVPEDKKFVIDKQKEWEQFRLEAFSQFKKCFNDVSERQIVLIFNNIDREKKPEAHKWVMNTIDPQIGFGIKGGDYNRGHHLSGEQSFKEKWIPFLVNPKGMKLFSAAEMDQSWLKPIFNINTELGFYWSALGGLNTGLSSYNCSKGAIRYAMKHDEIRDIFKMYNKYAQQVYPASATAAYSVFHEGLNAADTIKFPEKTFGVAKVKNLERYINICKAYASKGASLDDLNALTIGQVNQRERQTGYNDVGWEIAEGNYERFLTQINADQTSVGLYRVRGTIDKNSSKYDRFSRSFENVSGKNTMYFKFDDELFLKGKPKSLKFTITWLDKNAGSTWALRYSNGKQIKTAIEVKGKGDSKWKSVTVDVADMQLNHTGELKSDFVLVNTDKVDDIFNGIEVDIQRN